MKRRIKKIAKWSMALGIMILSIAACGDADEDIFRNADLEMEQMSDEENEKKSKPG